MVCLKCNDIGAIYTDDGVSPCDCLAVDRGMLREALAAYAHAAWSGWMEYLFSKCIPVPPEGSGAVTIPPAFVSRWKRRLQTPFVDLSEEEKDEGRAEANQILATCKAHAPLKFTGWFLGKRKAVEGVLREARRKLKREGGEHRELDVVDVLDALEEAGLLR
jgi:hypothetical protein